MVLLANLRLQNGFHLSHKADELRENFMNLFGIERLKSLSGKNLLTSLFYNDEGNKTNLCYMLEMDKDIREVWDKFHYMPENAMFQERFCSYLRKKCRIY